MNAVTKDNVRVGDILRRYHFTGARRRKHYLYHVVRWNEVKQALEAVPVESIATGDRSGSYWICSGVGVGAEIVKSLFGHLSEDDYQAKLREIRARQRKEWLAKLDDVREALRALDDKEQGR